MTIAAAVSPMSFECIDESARIHYGETQPFRVRKVATEGPQLGSPQDPHAEILGVVK